MKCPATHGALTCCRLNGYHPHPPPHMAHDGTQWDQHGIRVARGNDPYRSKK